ncbi:hypothetical protein JEOAER750_00297 [Jeotgalicoccus aerolatus]|uniref:Uncharacterized protein n=1 Tax=Jeotgalicoccus aerolatus TaxID=709510 RepID=A0A1G8WXC9_9STAP|nr:hypothetical protein [Jeotgalicoccus aerolatus]MBP1952465.1 hypothetical protein [Jeotgalicoccus aerolatus]NMA80962.1 hypothetical protein [Jeotgalicoccus aerolatus]CAD2072492.1 hypothetical protein JEOAER750_00297 [Jeotgalicoccus aerolatus]SDJ83019.1 hypothetical protein SAMN05216187_1036 [Jeotgalicoccus aerolatus]GGE04506.1 hypothetical protein GCM10007273_16330 [Jeotgalicoccus aerolatus]
MSDSRVIYLERKDVPKNYDPKGFNVKLFGLVVMSAYLLFIIFDLSYTTFRNIEESAFNRAYVIAIIIIIGIVAGFIFKSDKGDKYYQLHIAPSGMIIKFRRGQTVLPKKDITRITIERDIQTVIRFYKGEEILKDLNHIYLDHDAFVSRLRKLDYPVEDRTEADEEDLI